MKYSVVGYSVVADGWTVFVADWLSTVTLSFLFYPSLTCFGHALNLIFLPAHIFFPHQACMFIPSAAAASSNESGALLPESSDLKNRHYYASFERAYLCRHLGSEQQNPAAAMKM